MDLTSVEAMADSAPVRKLLNMVFLLAIKDQASDLHFEPFENEFKIRIRADGVLYEMVPPPRHLAFAITTRIKVMAEPRHRRTAAAPGRTNPIERGRAPHRHARQHAAHDVRRKRRLAVSSTARVVMLDLDVVGLDPTTLKALFPPTISASPTASCWSPGPRAPEKRPRSTADWLNRMNGRGQADHHRGPGRIRHRRHRADANRRQHRQHFRPVPAQYSAAGSRPHPRRRNPRPGNGRNRRAGLAYRPHGLQHIAHQRRPQHDYAVARHGRAAVPPHGHARSDPWPSGWCGRSAPKCREETMPSTDKLAELDLSRPTTSSERNIYRGRGCEACNNTGFKGRSGLFELMELNDALRDEINDGASTQRLREVAVKQGMRPLRISGLEKLTTASPPSKKLSAKRLSTTKCRMSKPNHE